MEKKTNFLESIIRFFIDNYRITYLVIFAIIIFGFISIYNIPKESSPEVNIPVVVIITPFPGAGAKNVEDLVTKNIEKQIINISGVDKVVSTSKQGLSTIMAQFDSSKDSNEKVSEIRNQVEKARSSLPKEAGDSIVQKISFSDVPVMKIIVSGPYSLSELDLYGKELKEEIESIKNISDVIITGAPEKEIKINFKEEKLLQYGVSPELISAIIASENIDFPLGLIKTGENNYSLRLDNKINSGKDIREIPLLNKEGAIITVEDLALVEEGYSNMDGITRFSFDAQSPEPTISLQIFKESGEGNILSIDKEIKEKIENIKQENFPNNVDIKIIQNDAETIRADLNMLLTSIFSTILIIFFILALFLGFRDAAIASISVPLSFLITFLVIDLVGLTINFLTLFSLVLSLGILVDASIVVTDSIFEKMFKGIGARESSILTIKEFGAPLIAGTLTTVFVFFPMLLVSGVMGEFMKSIPITVSTVLMASLFVSLVIITTISSKIHKEIKKDPDTGLFNFGRKIDKFISIYKDYLCIVLSKKKTMNLFLIVSVLSFFISLSFPFIGILSINMFPSPDSDNIFINVEMPQGTPLEITNNKVKIIEDYLLKDKYVESFFTFIGQSARAGSVSLAEGSNSNIGSINIILKDIKRPKSSYFVDLYRDEFKNIKGARIDISQTEAGPNQGGLVQINVIGKELEDIEKVATDFSKILSSIEGTENVNNGIKSNTGEFVITLKKEALKIYGISVLDITERIRTVVSGKVTTNIKKGEDEINVVISSLLNLDQNKIGNAKEIDVSDIYYIPIKTQKGVVPLETFIEIKIMPGRGTINREDGERIISITSEILSEYNSSKIVSDFKKRIEKENLPQGVEITYGGEVDEIQKSFMELFYSMIIGVIMIFILMVLQFRSYKQSFFILATIPLSLIGVIIGLSIVGQPLSFPAFIGVVALAGIVVNNAIILIDTINKKREEGEDILKAIIFSGEARFRPILLTTMTTIFGLIPLIFVGPVWAPVAYSIIFGLLFSTVLTLFIIPILYYKFENKK